MASAAPRRGKFLSAPSSSPSSSAPPTPSSRGKFLNRPSGSPSSIQGAASYGSNAAGDVDSTDSLAAVRSHIHTSKIAAASRRKAIAAQRDRVFQDLDEAEDVVLSLLECASDVAGALSDMTTAKSKTNNAENGEDDGQKKGTAESFEELTAKVRTNGVAYLAGVKSLHKLLAPHASLVKTYKNRNREQSATSADGEDPPSKTLSVISNPGGGMRTDKIVEEATSNMYAARVKKRLAMERREILKEMIRLEELEEEESCDGNDSAIMNADTAGSKRKR